MSGEATVKVGVSGADGVKAQFKSMAQGVKDFYSEVKRGESGGGGSSGGGGIAPLKQTGNNVDEVTQKFRRARIEAKGVGDEIKSLTQGASAFTGAAMPTPFKLLGGAGLTAAFAAAGALVANSVRLAAEFNRVSTQSTMQMTSNGQQLLGNLARFKSEAYSLMNQGIGPNESARMMGSYSMTSGRSPLGQTSALGSWARYSGQDPTTFGTMMGVYSQFAGGNVNANAAGIFGAANGSGDAGRRVGEFIGVATAVLQQLSTGAARNIDPRQALREVQMVAGAGGYFGTSAGLQTTLGAFNNIGNTSMSPQDASLAMRAGISMRQIIMGVPNNADKLKMFNQMMKDTGGGNTALLWAQQLAGSTAGGNALYQLAQQNGGRLSLGQYTNATNTDKLGAYDSSTAGKVARTLAAIDGTQTALGDKVLDVFSGSVDQFGQYVRDLIDGRSTPGGVAANWSRDHGLGDFVGYDTKPKGWLGSALQRAQTQMRIQSAGMENHFDPNLMRAILEMESNTGNDPSVARTGWNRDHTAAGWGQFTEASGISLADRNRAARDPAFAIQRMGQFIAQLYREHPGATAEQIANAYHSGNIYDAGDAAVGERRHKGVTYGQEVSALMNGRQIVDVPGAGKIQVTTTVRAVGGANTHGVTDGRR